MEYILGILFALAASVVMSGAAWVLSYEKFSAKKFARSVVATFIMALGISAGGQLFDVQTIYFNAVLSPVLGLFVSKGINYFKPVPAQFKGNLEELSKYIMPLVEMATWEPQAAQAKIESTQVTRPPEATEQ